MRSIRKALMKRINPKKYAIKSGINFKSFYVYGRVEWGTEPWIITLGENVHITDGVKFLTHDGGTLLFRDKIPSLDITKPIKVGDNVYFGNNSIILPGVTIGNNVIIGAGAVVTKNIPDGVVVGGVPARVIKKIDDYFEKIKNESTGLGALKGKEKDIALRKFFECSKNTKGIYF